MSLRVCLVSSEVTPFAKTGGLGDVCAALARYLHKKGHDVRPFLPLYGNLKPSGQSFVPVGFLQDVPVKMGSRSFTFSVFAATLPGSEVTAHFVACPALYGRAATYAADGDEHLRFAFLSRAAIESCQRMGFAPDVFHVNDWHAALVPVYLKTLYSWDRLFRRTKTVLTLHNLAYQGAFPVSVLHDIGLDGAKSMLDQDGLRAGKVSFLVTGILHADAITAVSETYAREIQTPEHGMGLDALLRARSGSVVGIVNGVDYDEWSPEIDALIPHRFSANDLAGKAKCKRGLLESVGLAYHPGAPVIGVVSRLTAQKGFDLAFEVLPRLLGERDLRLVALGSGSASLEDFFRGLERRFPRKVRFHNEYDNAKAHLIEAGADMFLMPSRFEPCGLNQMYSLRYGTVPIVRKTGGLADTVAPWNPATGDGTGFVFEHYTATGLAWALDQALTAWRDPRAWRRLVHNGMTQDFSWDRQIQKYIALYARLVG